MFLNRKKLIFIFLFLFAVSLVPNVSLAVDARCWTEEECIKFRSETLGLPLDKAKEGFYDKDDAVDICGKDTETDKNMGFCLPSSATKTSITFGGKNDFLHMGDFIQYMYRYGTWIIAVLAVVMIIVAGVQWVLSAGSADKIKEAQKRISGAVLGLILALLSYMILNLLNPYLVNLRLPQIWLVNSRLAPTEFCKDLSNLPTQKFMVVGSKDKELTEKAVGEKIKGKKEEDYTIVYDSGDAASLKSNFLCGQQLVYTSGDKDVCRGHYCAENDISKRRTSYGCMQNFGSSKREYVCKPAVIWGHVLKPSIVGTAWDYDDEDLVSNIELYVVCKNGQKGEVEDSGSFTNLNGKNLTYQVSATVDNMNKTASELCGSKGETAGFLIYPELDTRMWYADLDPFDQSHFLGVNPSSRKITYDLGMWDTANNFFVNLRKGVPYDGYTASDYLVTFDEIINGGRQLNIDMETIRNEEQ